LFKGNRHLRRRWLTIRRRSPLRLSRNRPWTRAPKWFARLIDVPSESELMPIAIGGQPYATIVLGSRPAQQMLDVWNDSTTSVIMLLLLAVRRSC